MRYHEWKTICFGRYLIDMPAIATVKQEWGIAGKTLRVLDGTAEQAKKMTLDKIAELKQQRHNDQGTMFRRAIELENGAILVHKWDFPGFVDTSSVFVYVPLQNSKIYYYENEMSQDREEQALRRSAQIGSSLRALAPDTIPHEPGCCMGDAILLETPMHRDEYGIISFFLPDAPYLNLSIHTFTVQDRPNPLTSKDVKERYRQLDAASPQTLRNGPHPVGPLPGYEICVAGVEDEARFRIFSYFWYAPGEVKNNRMPAINFKMAYHRLPFEAYKGSRPFATDQEALLMWDKMVNSIRLRPTEG